MNPPKVPLPIRAAIQALRGDPSGCLSLPESDWDEMLPFTDRTQLTLPLRGRLRSAGFWERLPERVRQRLDRNYADNAERRRRLQRLDAEVRSKLRAAGIEFVTLKGVSHETGFVSDSCERVQYDLDYFCPSDAVYRARDALLEMGYESWEAGEEFPTDHLPTLMPKGGRVWRGNYFDPDLAPSIDLHFRFWDPETERFAAPGVEDFWTRRTGEHLDLPDQLGYAALHALRHLLRGSLRPYHVYEIAHFLRQAGADFWPRWRRVHSAELRRLEDIVFRLATVWFCAPAPESEHSSDEWFARYAWSPIEAHFQPNKHEVLLHMTLVPGRWERLRVLRRRLAPVRVPHVSEAVYSPEKLLPKWARYTVFVAERFAYHARLLGPTVWALLRWRRVAR